MPESFPLHLALVWHMHQPYYKDMRTGKHIMPWVRLHATKDYLDMVEVLAEFPRVKANFNMVPSLMEQIDDLVGRGATDMVWDLTERPASALNDGEKKFLLQKFFYAHYDNMIKPHARYRELFEKRGWARNESELERAAQYYHEGDYRDLQVWYNLAWIDPLHIEKDPELQALVSRGRDFTEDDKSLVLRKHRELMARTAPAYREAEARGQIEVSTTPFYHPIMPLVYDTNLARVARPQIALPKQRFAHPEDVEAQVAAAVEYHEKTFGVRPRGMWPSEGSVAPEILPILAQHGIRWIATDEEVLGQSTGHQVRRDLPGVVQDPEHLYQPYWAEHEGARLAIIFRDHFLSDLIGFQYAGWDSQDAASDLVQRIEAVAKAADKRPHEAPLLMSIILDGENCWEHYHRDGLPFLRALYGMLQESKLIETVRVGDHIEAHPPRQTLPRLHTGSWINHDFSIWIGHKEDNQSWDYLHEVRELIATHIEQHGETLSESQIKMAWKEIYIAEGSDWNWWYGDDHSSGIDEEFDQLYREHLMTACLSVGLPPPSFLHIPITTKGQTGHASDPRAFIHPEIDGRNSSYYEWFAAGHFDPSLGGGSMHQAQYLLRRLFHGFDRLHFYFRVDAEHTILKPHEGDTVVLKVHLITPETYVLTIPLDGRPLGTADAHKTGRAASGPVGPGGLPVGNIFLGVGGQSGATSRPLTPDPTETHLGKGVLERELQGRLQKVKETGPVATGQIIEIALPFSDLGVEAGQEVYYYVTLEVNGREVERCPSRNPIRLETPGTDFETKMWVV